MKEIKVGDLVKNKGFYTKVTFMVVGFESPELLEVVNLSTKKKQFFLKEVLTKQVDKKGK